MVWSVYIYITLNKYMVDVDLGRLFEMPVTYIYIFMYKYVRTTFS